MSRVIHRPRFHSDGPFVARRALTLEGRTFEAGEGLIASAFENRLLRRLYEQGRIDFAAEAGEAPAPSTEAGEAEKPAEAAEADGAVTEPVTLEQPATTHTVQKVGMGGWQIIAPDGTPVGRAEKSEQAARTKAAALDAKAAG